jgi:hypothetical protein
MKNSGCNVDVAFHLLVKRRENLTGKRYGRYTVLGPHDVVRDTMRWVCRCDCGTEKVVWGNHLKAGSVVSCGCAQKETAAEYGKMNAASLIGQKFGRLTVIERSGSRNKKAVWICKCDCGKTKRVPTGALRNGNTQSCGCIQKETMHRIRFNTSLTAEERFFSRNREMAYPELHIWRQDVYKKDKWTCQFCSRKGVKDLKAHHADGWKENPDKRLDMSNGVTMCSTCHQGFHSIYGYGRNTRQQLDEYYLAVRGW